MKIGVNKIMVSAFALLLALTGCKSKKQLIPTTEKSANDSVVIFVTATGYVEPVKKVNVGTQVSGVIKKIYADYNTPVKEGQLLAEIDKSTLNEKLVQTKALLDNANSDLNFAKSNYERVKKLYDAKAETKVTMDDATNKFNQAKNQVKNAEANLHQAQVNLSYADIYSPISGVILSKDVDEGQTVAATFATPTLFTIANDLTKMQVEANVDEADIGQVKVGQPVEFGVDSYPDIVFNGTVQQIRLEPQVISNVVTYTVIIEAPNPNEKLYPGMTANVSIKTNVEKGVITQIGALRFNPDAEQLKFMNADAPEMKPSDKHVWIKQADKYTYTPVEIGSSDGVKVIVTKGLSADEDVVLSVSEDNDNKDEQKPASLMPKRPEPKKR